MCESRLATEREREARDVFDALYLAWTRACTDDLAFCSSMNLVLSSANKPNNIFRSALVVAAFLSFRSHFKF